MSMNNRVSRNLLQVCILVDAGQVAVGCFVYENVGILCKACKELETLGKNPSQIIASSSANGILTYLQ
jgi:hypothetical protein